METGNLIWLIAGIGIGLVLAMGLFAGLSWLERRRFARRLRTARTVRSVSAAVDQPKATIAAASLLARASQRTEPPGAEPPAQPVVAPPVEEAVAVQPQPVVHEAQPAEPPSPAGSDAQGGEFGPDEADAAEPTEQTDVAIEPARPVAEEPADATPKAPPRLGIQAAVAEAAARRRAAREAGLLPQVPPPVVPAAPGGSSAAASEAPSVNVEELFEKAFGTATPLVPDAGDADDGEKAP